MAYARALRVGGAVPACGGLLLGCTGGGTGGSASPPVASETARRAAASATSESDPAREPKTASQARALIERVISGPELFSTGVLRATPYESEPGQWAVLGDDCVWRLEPLPGDTLATLTRHFEVPAAGRRAPCGCRPRGALRRGTRPVVRRGLRRRRPDRPIPRHTRDHNHDQARTGRRGPLPPLVRRRRKADPFRPGHHPHDEPGEHRVPVPGQRRHVPLPGAL